MNITGAVRSLAGSTCPPGMMLIDLAKDGPVNICVSLWTGHWRWSPTPGCVSGEQLLRLPSLAPVQACVSPMTGAVRRTNPSSGCGAGWMSASTGTIVSDVICSGMSCFSFQRMADNIENALAGNVVGYGFVLSYKGQAMHDVAGGLGRTAADPPVVPFTTTERMHIASVSKTITAVAVQQLLTANGFSVDTPIAAYLPSSWTLGPNAGSITFRELLAQTSGIRSYAIPDFAHIQTLMAAGINLADKTYQYDNANYGIFQIIIPYLDGFSETGVVDLPGALATAYIDYMNQHVFAPIGLPTVSCAPPALNPFLFYPFPPGAAHGTDFGDFSLFCAAGGLILSVQDLATFLAQLRFSETLLTAAQRSQMDAGLLGWQLAVTGQAEVGQYRGHGGILCQPCTNPMTPVSLTLLSTIIDFTTDIQFTLIVNSPVSPAGNFLWLEPIVLAAYDDAWTAN